MSASLPPNDVWSAAGSGLWSSGANWSLGFAPLRASVADIEPLAPLTVTFDLGNVTVAGLVLAGATLALEGGGLTVSGAARLAKATLSGSKPLTLFGASLLQPLTATADATLALGGAARLNNRGAVTQSGETVAIGDSASSTAAIVNFAGATWTIADASGMTQGATAGWTFYNYGTFRKTSDSGFARIAANFYSTGTIASQGGGDIIFDGKLTRLSGTFIGSGMIDYGPNGLTTLGVVDVTGSTCQTNFGTVNLVGDMTMHDGSTIMNEMGAHWNFAADVSLWLAAGEAAGPDFNGMGGVAKTAGAGVSHVGIDFETMGTVSVYTGTLSFEGASSAFAGLINGAGTFQIGGGAARLEAGTRLSVAHWTLAGGVTTLASSLSYAGAFAGVAGAALDLGGATLTLTGASAFSGLALRGTGALTLRGSASVSGLTIGGKVAMRDYGAVTQSGDVRLGGLGVTDAASLSIAAGGSWTLSGAVNLLAGTSKGSRIAIGSGPNSGLIAKTGLGVATVAPAIINNGVNSGAGPKPTLGGIEVTAGTLQIKSAVTGTGMDNIVDAGTLEFDAAVSAGQTIAFWGQSGGALFLTDLAEFHGAIKNFCAGGATNVIGVAGWDYLNATTTAASTALTFSHNGATAALVLTGDYRAGHFSASGGQDSQGQSVALLSYAEPVVKS